MITWRIVVLFVAHVLAAIRRLGEDFEASLELMLTVGDERELNFPFRCRSSHGP